MSNFDGIGDVSVSDTLPYIEPGNYVFSCDRMLVGTSSQKGKGDFFVTEFTVESSSRGDAPAGSRRGWPLMFNKGEITLVNIKACVAALANVPHEKITRRVMDAAVEGEGTRLAGKKVVCQATASTTKAGHPFTKMMWTPYEEGNSFQPQAVPVHWNPGDQRAAPVGQPPVQSDGGFSADEIPF